MLYAGANRSLLGLGIGRMGSVGGTGGTSLEAQIKAIFAGGEQGAWYEPSLTNGTLFQDSAGTTPVTAVGQPVGLMLDKSGRGNHATQPTAINRPVLSARVNLLTKTEDFLDAVWSRAATTIAATATAVEFRFTADATAGIHGMSQTPANSYNQPYMSVEVKADGHRYVALGNSGQSGAFASFDLQTGTKGFNPNIGRIVNLGDGWYRIVCKPFGDNSNNAAGDWSMRLMPDATSNGNSTSWTGDGISGILIRRPQYQPVLGPVATVSHPAYQRVNTATDYDAVGFPLKLQYDGIDDVLVITFPASLGSSCTICRAIPGVGASILTGQTIGTSYSGSTSHAGLIIINRALTAAETASMTAYLNAKAGGA